MKKKLKLNILLSALLILVSLEVMGILPGILARCSSKIYVTINYPKKKFKFDSIEYSPQFGDYSIKYKSTSEKDLGIMMFPKEFPIFIRYDSIKKQG